MKLAHLATFTVGALDFWSSALLMTTSRYLVFRSSQKLSTFLPNLFSRKLLKSAF
jgi:hypothetical protein